MKKTITKLVRITAVILLFSCSSVEQFTQFQSPQVGKDFQYLVKPTSVDKDSTIEFVQYSFTESQPFYKKDSEHSFHLAYGKSSKLDNLYFSASPFIYYGKYNSNSFKEDSLNASSTYYGLGIRSELGIDLSYTHFTLRPLALQIVVSFEMGDYFKYRKDLSDKIKNFINIGSSKLTLSMFYTPELRINVTKGFSVGVYGGIGFSKNDEESESVGSYGLNFTMSPYTLYFQSSTFTFEDKVNVSDLYFFSIKEAESSLSYNTIIAGVVYSF